MDVFFFNDFQSFYTVSCLEYFIPLTFQIYLYTFSDLLVVFYNQYMIHLHLISHPFS